MLQARIVSSRGSLYFAAEATPYDLENLRTHIRDLRTASAKDVRLEISLDRTDDAVANVQVSAWLRRLKAEGVQVSFSPSFVPAAGTRSRRSMPLRS
jgi:hypothetical protein